MVELDHQRSAANTLVNKMRLGGGARASGTEWRERVFYSSP